MEIDGVCDEFLKMEVDPQPGPSTASARATSQHSKPRISYFFDDSACVTHYGKGHPMKPHRIRLAHDLIMAYGLHNKMVIYRPHRASPEQMALFHNEDYIWFLRHIDPVNKGTPENTRLMQTYEAQDDCPIFESMYEFCQLTSGASICGAAKLNKREYDIVINWSGGLHHAKKDGPSGFCYVNDIVLAILELLKYHTRVLYVDIDVHHGDGVEEAFLTTDRVMTVSFHKFGDDFFPGTGDIGHIGVGPGKYYSLNVPLKDGMDDRSYTDMFSTIMSRVMESYRPEAIVLQCGADSLSRDRLGKFNLSLSGHGNCVSFLKKYNIPLLLLGGGGYTVKNVARLWAYETSIALGVDLPNKIPFREEHVFYFPLKSKLHFNIERNVSNRNTKKYLNDIKATVLENLRNLPFAPSVEMLQTPGPSAFEQAHVAGGGRQRSRGRGRGRGNSRNTIQSRTPSQSRSRSRSRPSNQNGQPSRQRSGGIQTRQSASKDE